MNKVFASMRDLRFPRFWLVGGWIAVMAAFIICILPERMVEVPGANDKMEHASGYVLLTLWFCGIFSRSKYWAVVLAFLLFGILIEIVQGSMNWGRHADVNDVYADAAGILVGVLLALSPLQHWPRWLESLIPRKVVRE